jgi:L-lactate dehydrogenase complex protein LldG
MTAKAEFFARIRQRMPAAAPRSGAGLSERPGSPAEAAALILRQQSERWRETLERFRTEFARVGGVFHRAGAMADVPAMIARLARERQAARLISWAPAALGADWTGPLRAAGLTVNAMPPGAIDDEANRPALRRLIADAEIGLTGADLAVAGTGRLVLISGAGRPRSTSLLPACHVAVFGRDALVESLAELGVFLEAWHADRVPLWKGGVINVITGPSRTADIELTLTRGVHGPQELHAAFVDGVSALSTESLGAGLGPASAAGGSAP